MANDYEERQRKTKIFLHSLYDYSMGVLWLCAGGFFLLYKKFGIELNFDSILTTIFGISAVLYGAFRIYRGYQKNY
ncbi:MAG: hypothetical protein ACHQF0_07660 [Chitinophagales bacterium]